MNMTPPHLNSPDHTLIAADTEAEFKSFVMNNKAFFPSFH